MALRQALLDAASELLVSEGPGALSMRRIAAAVGCSTTVLYTLFGSKDGVAEALFREGFERFGHHLRAVPAGPDALAHLEGLGRAYRHSALAGRNYYGLMFEQAIPGFTPSAEARSHAWSTLQVLIDAVARCVEDGVFRGGDPVAMAEVIWAAAHGAVSLELAGFFADAGTAAERFRAVTAAVVSSFL
jgi:AcrR family transcriptional regulator